MLDTHIAIWLATDEAELLPAERVALDAADALVVSAVSIWEIRLKWHSFHASGERKGVIAPGQLVAVAVAAGWTLLPLTAAHAAAALRSAVPHKDPFDELILTQAQEEGLRLLTRDKHLVGHPLAY